MACEHCCCECRREAGKRLKVQPRRAGANLSVDVVVGGAYGNLPLPANWTDQPRVDHIRIGGESFDITVLPGAPVIREGHIKRTA